MPYNFDQIPNRRLPNVANKWTLYPKDTLPMWLADMDFAAPPAIQRALHRFVEHGDLGYQLAAQALKESVVARMEKLYDWKISPEMIVPIPGVNSGYNAAARAFCTSRRGYLIQTPVYNEFFETQKKTGAPQVTARMEKKITGNRIRYEVDFDAFARGVQKVSLFLLCNPHNPVGKIFSRAELKRMAKLCVQNDVLIVSDEIHSELILNGARHIPLATLSDEIADKTITLIASSKTFNTAGLFCAFAIIPNAELRERFKLVNEQITGHVSSLGLIAAEAAFCGACDEWLAELLVYLKDNRDFLTDCLAEKFPECRFTIPDATYLQWIDFGAYVKSGRIPTSPHQFFLEQARVAVNDGAQFGEGFEHFVRFNFGAPRSLIEEGLERMRKALT